MKNNKISRQNFSFESGNASRSTNTSTSILRNKTEVAKLSLFLSLSLSRSLSRSLARSLHPFSLPQRNALHFDTKANIIKVLPFHLCLATINDTRRYLPQDMKYTRDEISYPLYSTVSLCVCVCVYVCMCVCVCVCVCVRNTYFYRSCDLGIYAFMCQRATLPCQFCK